MRLHKKLFLGTIIFLFLNLLLPSLVFANDADPGQSTISVSSGSIPADGSTTATISITVKDNSGNAISGDHVTLTSTTDSGLIINTETVGSINSTAATDSNGNVTFTVKSNNPSPGTDTFTAADTSDNPNVLIANGNSVSVTFTPSALAPDTSCADGAPGSTPELVSASASGTNQIILTWTDASDPVSSYLLAFGLSPSQYIYGNPNMGGQGTTSYTVGSLNPGTTYYFAIKAVNGCNSGSFSNEVSAVAGGTPTDAPVATQAPSDTPPDVNTQNDVAPTDTPIQMQNVQAVDTDTPVPTPTPIAGISETKVIGYILAAILLFGGIGGFIYWKHKKSLEKFPNVGSGEDQLGQDFKQ
jgi:hypothetical protein